MQIEEFATRMRPTCGFLYIAGLEQRVEACECVGLKNAGELQWSNLPGHVRPESRLNFCFTEQVRSDETGCSINRSLPRHEEPVTARCEALGTM